MDQGRYFDGESWDRELVVADQLSRARERVDRFGFELRQDDVLSEPLSVEVVDHFETQCRVRLPLDYRSFLLQVGDGGIGPGVAMRRLGAPFDDGRLDDWQPGDVFPDGSYSSLDKPFPHSSRVAGGYPAEFFQALDDPDNVDLSLGFEPGALYLFDFGCAVWTSLIVTGPSAGQVWTDSRTDNRGLYPQLDDGGVPVDFARFYTDWLRSDGGYDG